MFTPRSFMPVAALVLAAAAQPAAAAGHAASVARASQFTRHLATRMPAPLRQALADDDTIHRG